MIKFTVVDNNGKVTHMGATDNASYLAELGFRVLDNSHNLLVQPDTEELPFVASLLPKLQWVRQGASSMAADALGVYQITWTKDYYIFMGHTYKLLKDAENAVLQQRLRLLSKFITLI